jgi:hypothetical protein
VLFGQRWTFLAGTTTVRFGNGRMRTTLRPPCTFATTGHTVVVRQVALAVSRDKVLEHVVGVIQVDMVDKHVI